MVAPKEKELPLIGIPPFLRCPECTSERQLGNSVSNAVGELVCCNDITPLPAPFNVTSGARCGSCEREFPYISGVWVLWSDQVKRLQTCQLDEISNGDIESRVKHANIQVYDQAAEHYEENTQEDYFASVLRHKEEAEQLLATDNQERILVDVGCSTRTGYEHELQRYSVVVGLDISLSNLLPLVNRGVLPVLADAEKMPLEENSVDVISSFAAIHHFPHPEEFIGNSYRALKVGGVLVTAGDPSKAALKRGPLAQFVWTCRRPVYRLLARFSNRYHLHTSKQFQNVNDLAEFQRTGGGFDPEDLRQQLKQAGFRVSNVFYDTYSLDGRAIKLPSWKMVILKLLSFQNPLLVRNWSTLSILAQK